MILEPCHRGRHCFSQLVCCELFILQVIPMLMRASRPSQHQQRQSDGGAHQSIWTLDKSYNTLPPFFPALTTLLHLGHLRAEFPGVAGRHIPTITVFLKGDNVYHPVLDLYRPAPVWFRHGIGIWCRIKCLALVDDASDGVN